MSNRPETIGDGMVLSLDPPHEIKFGAVHQSHLNDLEWSIASEDSEHESNLCKKSVCHTSGNK